MKWREIRIVTTNEAADAVSEMLDSFGAGGVLIEDPYEIRKEIEKVDHLDCVDDSLNQLGEDVTIKAYFNEEVDIERIIAGIKERLENINAYLPVGRGFAGVFEVDDEDWSNAWKKYYKPLQVSKRVVVKPSWEEYKAGGDEIIIELDPGMAFGTGSHETTRMCADMLDRFIKQGDTVMDVGCGSGILSIIAAKLGACKVVAFDIDEVAVKVTRENIARNSVEDRVEVFKGVLEDVAPKKYNIIVANIIADVIISIAELIPRYLQAGGLFIASGIIKERRNDVADTYLKLGFELQEEKTEGEWVTLALAKVGED